LFATISTTTDELPGRVSSLPKVFPAPVGVDGRVLFNQTVPRQLVHRAAVSEVLLTDVCVLGDTSFQVGAQWPRGHSFFGLADAPYHDPMIFAETIRQAALVLAHRVFGVDRGWKFLSHEKSYQISRVGLALGARPADVMLTVDCFDIKRRGQTVTGMRMELGCYRDGTRVGSGEVRWSCVSPTVYSRLRGGRDQPGQFTVDIPRPVPRALVGRERSMDVVLSPAAGENTWLVRIDQSHPILFDHPVDHVPGMLTMEAARQAAQLSLGRADILPVGGTFSFDHYIEFDQPTMVTALPLPNGQVKVSFDQGGRVVAHGVLDVEPCD
jgi:hypothetical protein